MGMTPPRCPRVGAGFAAGETLIRLADFSRSSKLAEESKAGSTSPVVRAVIVVPHQIYAPALTDPPPPSYGHRLTLKIVETHGWPDELICLYAETRAQRKVLSLVSSMGYGDEARRREHRSRIADVETNSFFKNPVCCEVVRRTDKKTMIAMDVFRGIVAEAEGRDQLLVSHPFLVD